MTVLRKRPRREVETVDFLRMVGRMLTAASERVAKCDEDEFRELARLEVVLRQVLDEAVVGLRKSGFTWQEIGDAAGTTRQAAHERWARKVADAA